jgi:general secretion pathway protein C
MWPAASASDHVGRRAIRALVLAGTLGAAYWQARGAMWLLDAHLSEALAARRSHASSTLSPRPPTPRPGLPKSAAAVLVRNPFDSSTGPLLGEASLSPSPPPAPGEPLTAPVCEDLVVTIITTGRTPQEAAAAVKDASAERPPRLRVGDRVGDAEVAFIGDNPLTGSPTVWLERGSSLCQLSLFGAASPAPTAPGSTEGEPASTMPGFAQPGQTILDNGPKLLARAASPDIAARIKRVDTDEFEVDRRVLSSALENQSDLLRELRIQPNPAAPGSSMVRAVNVRSSTLLGLLGFSSGDVLLRVNGESLGAAETALQVYGKLQTSTEIRVEVERAGNVRTLLYRVQ